jgi:hypothetical protein
MSLPSGLTFRDRITVTGPPWFSAASASATERSYATSGTSPQRAAGIVKVKLNSRRNAAGKVERYEHEIGAIDSLAQIRAEVITVVKEEISLDDHKRDRFPGRALDQRRRRTKPRSRCVSLLAISVEGGSIVQRCCAA